MTPSKGNRRVPFARMALLVLAASFAFGGCHAGITDRLDKIERAIEMQNRLPGRQPAPGIVGTVTDSEVAGVSGIFDSTRVKVALDENSKEARIGDWLYFFRPSESLYLGRGRVEGVAKKRVNGRQLLIVWISYGSADPEMSLEVAKGDRATSDPEG